MKKIFEEPTLECVRITSEAVTGDGIPEMEGGVISKDFW